MSGFDLVLLGLCLWACVATGFAVHFYRRFEMGKLIIYVLGSELKQIAMGELEVKIVGNEVVRTQLKEVNHGV